MDVNQSIADLMEHQGGICTLDKIYLPYARANAGPAVKFGLGCELFLPNIDRSILREQVLQCLLDFQGMFPNRIDQFLPQNSRRTRKISGDLENKVRSQFQLHPAHTGYSTSLFGGIDTDLPNDDIEPYQAHALVKRSDYPELSVFSTHMPICDDLGRPNFQSLLDSTLGWCSMACPAHGSAGFAFTFASGMQQNTKYAFQMMQRFPGFDFVDGLSFSRQTESNHDCIKSINWLTVLSDDIIATIGGKVHMCTTLEPICRIHNYSGGVVIQAGAHPQIGDTWRNDIPEAYRMVARYTKSIRFEGYTDSLFRVPDGLDDVEEALSWVGRFD